MQHLGLLGFPEDTRLIGEDGEVRTGREKSPEVFGGQSIQQSPMKERGQGW